MYRTSASHNDDLSPADDANRCVFQALLLAGGVLVVALLVIEGVLA